MDLTIEFTEFHLNLYIYSPLTTLCLFVFEGLGMFCYLCALGLKFLVLAMDLAVAYYSIILWTICILLHKPCNSSFEESVLKLLCVHISKYLQCMFVFEMCLFNKDCIEAAFFVFNLHSRRSAQERYIGRHWWHRLATPLCGTLYRAS